jgi:hypothetical protein
MEDLVSTSVIQPVVVMNVATGRLGFNQAGQSIPVEFCPVIGVS